MQLILEEEDLIKAVDLYTSHMGLSGGTVESVKFSLKRTGMETIVNYAAPKRDPSVPTPRVITEGSDTKPEPVKVEKEEPALVVTDMPSPVTAAKEVPVPDSKPKKQLFGN